MARSPNPAMDGPRTEIDFVTGRPVLSAPRRRERPLHTAPDAALGSCPFCPGEEHQTPPERDAVREQGTAPDTPGWRARAFQNLFPAAVWHEVLVEGAQHATQPADLDHATLSDGVELWCRRIAAMDAEPDVHAPLLFKNVGRYAGASIHHNHSQLMGFPELPPRFAALVRRHHTHGSAAEFVLRGAEAEQRVVVSGEHHTALTPPTPRMPNELWILPHVHTHDVLDTPHRADLVEVLRRTFVATREAFDSPAFNLWLNRIPGVTGGYPWSFQLQPRTGFLAGLELGGGMTINAVPAAESAARYRAGLDRAEHGESS